MHVNPEKERAKAYLRTDVVSCQSTLLYESNETHQLISVLANMTAGSVVGADQRIIAHCQDALQCYSRALSFLNEVKS